MNWVVGSFVCDTSKAVGQTFDVTSLSFEPTLVKFFGSPNTANGITGHARMMFGADDGSGRFCAGYGSEHNQGESQAWSAMYLDASYISYTNELHNGRGKISAFLPNGFRLEIVDQHATADIIYFLATDAPNIVVGTFETNTSPGTQTISDLGLDPDLVEFASGYRSIGCGQFFIGVSDGTTEYVRAISSEHDRGSADTASYIYNGECIAMMVDQDANLIGLRATMDSLGSNQFVIDILEAKAFAVPIGYIAYEGVHFELGDDTMGIIIGTKDIDIVGGFDPLAVFFVGSGETTWSTQDTTSINAVVSIGAGDGSTQAYGSCWDQDAAGVTDCASDRDINGVFMGWTYSETQDSLMELDSLGVEKFTVDTLDAGDALKFWYIAFGDVSIYEAPAYSRRYIRPRTREHNLNEEISKLIEIVE